MMTGKIGSSKSDDGSAATQLQGDCGCCVAWLHRRWRSKAVGGDFSAHQLAVTAEASTDGWLCKRQRWLPQGPPALPVT